jgi:hypothetical protein
MDNPDFVAPELFDRRDVLIIMKKKFVENARAEIARLEAVKRFNPDADIADDMRCWCNSLVIRLAELHIAMIF